MVVVPTSPDVTLTFSRTWAENLGMLLTAAGLLGLGSWGAFRWLRRRRTAATGPS
jgi:hypothetical protein